MKVKYRGWRSILLAGSIVSSVSASAVEQVGWYRQGQDAIAKSLAEQANTNRAKNIILFVGDGMGVTTVTAARIYAGQLQGNTGEENFLSFEKFPYSAFSKTYNTNQQTPDSAGTMTAMMTGWKTKAGFISVNEKPKLGECKKSLQNKLPTFLEQAEEAGLATGVVTTARVTHATPAATYAHTPHRNWEDDSAMSAQAIKEGCKDIAAQLVEFNKGDGIEVVLGGGKRHFVSQGGKRKDGRDLIAEWTAKYPQSAYVENRRQLAEVDVNKTEKLLGLFNKKHMQYSLKHDDQTQEPDLPVMTEKAIAMLSKNDKGFFLMVESGRIDHGHHANHAKKALTEAVVFDRAIEKALSMVDLKETLIIVTADHSHVMTMGGYPTRGNPILGKMIMNSDDNGEPLTEPELAADGMPWTTLNYTDGGSAKKQRQDIYDINTAGDDYRQQSLIPLDYGETHGGEDVGIYAVGPWAHLIRGVQEQNYIYHVMKHAAQLDKR